MLAAAREHDGRPRSPLKRDGPEDCRGYKRFFQCPEALSAYQHTKAEAVLQRGGYRVLPLNASGCFREMESAGAEAPAFPERPLFAETKASGLKPGPARKLG